MSLIYTFRYSGLWRSPFRSKSRKIAFAIPNPTHKYSHGTQLWKANEASNFYRPISSMSAEIDYVLFFSADCWPILVSAEL